MNCTLLHIGSITKMSRNLFSRLLMFAGCRFSSPKPLPKKKALPAGVALVFQFALAVPALAVTYYALDTNLGSGSSIYFNLSYYFPQSLTGAATYTNVQLAGGQVAGGAYNITKVANSAGTVVTNGNIGSVTLSYNSGNSTYQVNAPLSYYIYTEKWYYVSGVSGTPGGAIYSCQTGTTLVTSSCSTIYGSNIMVNKLGSAQSPNIPASQLPAFNSLIAPEIDGSSLPKGILLLVCLFFLGRKQIETKSS